MSDGNLLYARAKPEFVKFTETYFYKQEISHNSYIVRNLQKTLTGKIEIDVPYDGEQCFTMEAYRDVEKQLKKKFGQPTELLIGHLLLANLEKQKIEPSNDLSKELKPYNALPLEISLLYPPSSNRLYRLVQGRDTCQITYDYTPGQPEDIPVELEMALMDEETWQIEEDKNPQSTQPFTGFQRGLKLITRVKLNLPKELDGDNLNAWVSLISFDWPTITSLQSVRLKNGKQSHRLTYNPTTRKLEGRKIPLLKKVSKDDKTYYQSSAIILEIDQPGELNDLEQFPSLLGKVEVELEGKLWSGLEPRLYDSLGKPGKLDPKKLISRFSTEVELMLGDAFHWRELAPFQYFYFNEIIPTEMRIADIETPLRNRGFSIEQVEAPTLNEKGLFCRLDAWLGQGDDKITLWIDIEGERTTVERKTEIPGGQTITSMIPSGELKVRVQGFQRRNSERVIQEINALHAALRDRFQAVRAKM